MTTGFKLPSHFISGKGKEPGVGDSLPSIRDKDFLKGSGVKVEIFGYRPLTHEVSDMKEEETLEPEDKGSRMKV